MSELRTQIERELHFEHQMKKDDYSQRNIPPVLFDAICTACDMLDVTGESSPLAKELAVAETYGTRLGSA
jgi:hypothetical protein